MFSAFYIFLETSEIPVIHLPRFGGWVYSNIGLTSSLKRHFAVSFEVSYKYSHCLRVSAPRLFAFYFILCPPFSLLKIIFASTEVLFVIMKRSSAQFKFSKKNNSLREFGSLHPLSYLLWKLDHFSLFIFLPDKYISFQCQIFRYYATVNVLTKRTLRAGVTSPNWKHKSN